MAANEKYKLFLFRCILLLLVLGALEAIGYLGLWLNSRSFDHLSNKNYFQIRHMLMASSDADQLPRYLSQPYLGYVPYPGYRKQGMQQHNEDGYRGSRVPVAGTGKYRVLCLGGSTTYGFGVTDPSQTFPARLEVLLDAYIRADAELSKKYTGAEVLNAGLEAGNSAEELQQYLFKYRYYRPQAVIVHSGINDALLTANASPDYQLDYTHHRRLNFHLEALPTPTRWFMRSYFFSFLSIRLFYDNFSKNRDEFLHQDIQTFCRWSHVNADSIVAGSHYETYPFYRNSRTLYAEIIRDSALLMVLPNILNLNSELVKSNPKYRDLSELNVHLSEKLATEFGAVYIPFTFDSVKNAAYWIDDCHLDQRGEADKALLILPHIIKQLTPSVSSNDTVQK